MTAETAASSTPDSVFPHIDIDSANSPTFRNWLADVRTWTEANEAFANDFEHPDGWNTVDRTFQLKAVIKNAANRDPSLANIRYLAHQMRIGEFKETGVPLIFDLHGNGVDLQHRVMAGLLSGVTFTSYVVNLREDIPSVFAYFDQGKPRTHAEILKTAGYGESSPLLAASVKMSMHLEADCYTATSAKNLGKIAPKMALDYLLSHPELKQAANLMQGQNRSATKLIGKPDVATVVCFEIIKGHDEFVADEFFEQVGIEHNEGARAVGDPIAVMQHELAVDSISKDPMERHQVLGLVIKGFNAWIKEESVRKLAMRVNEPFPHLWGKVEAMAQAKAAE